MKIKNLWIVTASVVILLLVSGLFRTSPEAHLHEFINTQINENPGISHIKPIVVQSVDNYAIARVEYKLSKGFTPPENWFIKDRTKLNEEPSGSITGQGFIYLVKDDLFSWEVIK